MIDNSKLHEENQCEDLPNISTYLVHDVRNKNHEDGKANRNPQVTCTWRDERGHWLGFH